MHAIIRTIIIIRTVMVTMMLPNVLYCIVL
jgi:hypothetical protein